MQKKLLKEVINNSKTIIFDCDGVIFDSNNLKSKIFKEVLEDKEIDQKNIDSFIKYHRDNGGISRYKKIDYLESNILKIKKKSFKKEILDAYSFKVVDMYLNEARYVYGLIEFLKNIKSKQKSDMYIVSGSDENELNYIFKKKKISHFFRKIYGSPKTKKEIISNILSKIKKSNITYIGDSKLDYEMANFFKFDFIFMNYNPDISYSSLKKKSIFKINNYYDLI